MIRKPVIQVEAKRDFDEAIDWNKKHQKDRGKAFAAEVKRLLKLLRRMPKMHGIVIDDVRRAIVKGSSYVILYRVTDTEVIVISIFHTSRDPSDWQSRI